MPNVLDYVVPPSARPRAADDLEYEHAERAERGRLLRRRLMWYAGACIALLLVGTLFEAAFHARPANRGLAHAVLNGNEELAVTRTRLMAGCAASAVSAAFYAAVIARARRAR